MRKFFTFLAMLFSAFAVGALIAEAVSILTVPQGGSGQGYFASSTPLVGSGINGLIATTTLRVDYIHATSTTATSTFEGGVKTNLLNVTSGTASSTFTGGITVGGGIQGSTYNCSTYTNGGKVTTNAAGFLTCANDSGGTGLTTLNGLTTDPQTFSAVNIPLSSLRYTTLTISSAGSVHSFIAEASSSPTFGFLNATTTLAVGTSTQSRGFYVAGSDIDLDTQNINIGSSTSATTSINYFGYSTTTLSTIGINAFSIATSTRKGTNQSVPILSFDTSNSRVGIATSQPSTSFSVNGPIFADGAIGIGRVTTTQGMLEVASNTLISGILNVGNVSTSTFQNGVQANLLNIIGNASSTFTGGLVVGGGVKLSTYNCSTYASGGRLTTDVNGYLTCAAGSAGGGITTLNGLTTDPQTFSAVNIPLSSLRYTTLTISSAGSVHSFIAEASSSPTFGNLVATSTFGVATSSPGQKLAVAGDIFFDANAINIGTSSSASTTINYFASATTTIPNNLINAFSIATSTRKGTLSAAPFLTFDTSNSRIGVATSQPSASFSVGGNIFVDGGIGIGRTTTTPGGLETSSTTLIGGNLYVTGNGTSTFKNPLETSLLNITSTSASSTFSGGIVVAGGVKLSTYNCSTGYSNGGKLSIDANGYLNCQNDSGGSPGGSNTQVQFNDSSSFGGSSTFTWNKNTNVLTITGGLIDTLSTSTDATSTNLWISNNTRIASSTIGGQLTIGYWNATSTTATSTSSGGISILEGGLKIGNLNCTGLTNSGKLTADASGIINCSNDVSGSGSPGGANTQVQFNNSSAFGGSANFTWLNATSTAFVYGTSSAITFALNASTSAITVNGTNATSTIVLTAGGGSPTLLKSAQGPYQATTTTSLNDFWAIDFNAAIDQCAMWNVTMPNSWDGGGLQARYYWTATSSTGGVSWGMRAVAYAQNTAMDTAPSATSTVSQTLVTSNSMQITQYTSKFVPAGNPQPGGMIIFTLCRDTANASDTLSNNAQFIQAVIEYEKKQFSD